jgi:PAS domain S-box-containing protein
MRFDGRPETLEMLREIAENIVDPVFLVDKGFNVWYYNRAFEQAVGVRMSSRQYKDRPCHELLGLSICKDACIMKQAVSQKKAVRLAEIVGRTAGAEDKMFHMNAVPVTGGDGNPFGALIFLRDITAEAQMQEKYKRLVARNAGIALSGQLENNLIDVLQLLSFLQKSGQLTLHRGESEGAVVFERGQMVAAALGAAINVKALDRLLSWPDGSFTFSPKVAVAVTSRFEGSADFILMDLVRERDELASRRQEMPDVMVRPCLARAPTETDTDMAGAPLALCEHLVTGPTLAETLEALEHSDTRLMLALLRLRDKGVVTW